jgi:hypothetical protein
VYTLTYLSRLIHLVACVAVAPLLLLRDTQWWHQANTEALTPIWSILYTAVADTPRHSGRCVPTCSASEASRARRRLKASPLRAAAPRAAEAAAEEEKQTAIPVRRVGCDRACPPSRRANPSMCHIAWGRTPRLKVPGERRSSQHSQSGQCKTRCPWVYRRRPHARLLGRCGSR